MCAILKVNMQPNSEVESTFVHVAGCLLTLRSLYFYFFYFLCLLPFSFDFIRSGERAVTTGSGLRMETGTLTISDIFTVIFYPRGMSLF